jgi:thioredoxin-related protein
MNLQKIIALISGVLAAVLFSIFCYLGIKSILDNKNQSQLLQDKISQGKLFGNLEKLPNFNNSKKTLIVGLSTSCHFCNESVPFYKKLAKTVNLRKNKINLVAVFREDKIFVENYFSKHNLQIATISDVDFDEIDISGTPTVMLFDEQKEIVETWRGRLDTAKEEEVLSTISVEDK